MVSYINLPVKVLGEDRYQAACSKVSHRQFVDPGSCLHSILPALRTGWVQVSGGAWPSISTEAGNCGAKAAGPPAGEGGRKNVGRNDSANTDGTRKNSFGRNDSANSADSYTQRMLPPRLSRAAPSSISETEALDAPQPAPGACDEVTYGTSDLPVDAKIGTDCLWHWPASWRESSVKCGMIISDLCRGA